MRYRCHFPQLECPDVSSNEICLEKKNDFDILKDVFQPNGGAYAQTHIHGFFAFVVGP